MGKNNSFLARQQLRQRILIDNARRYTIQQCADFMLWEERYRQEG